VLVLLQNWWINFRQPLMKQPLAIYIHWPFCRKKCPYCDFNSYVSDHFHDIDHDAWLCAYETEMATYAAMLGDRQVTSIFFGGGTPSLMSPKTVEGIICAIHRHWGMAKDCEITLEANPTSIEADKFYDFRCAGINRVSVGIQSLRDESLQFLGREHSAAEALRALDIANTIFDRTSFDLIYARPHQTLEEWEKELREAVGYAKGHMSLYQLTIEDNTQFKTLRDSGRLAELDGDTAADLYVMTQSIMDNAGMPAYEISNHAVQGQEGRHNLTYWRYGDYAGIGPGAHGRLTLPDGERIATRAHKAPEIWMGRVTGEGHGAHPFINLDKITQAEERLMMNMRLREGMDITGYDIDWDVLHQFIENRMIVKDGDRLYVPVSSWPVLDGLIARIMMAMTVKNTCAGT